MSATLLRVLTGVALLAGAVGVVFSPTPASLGAAPLSASLASGASLPPATQAWFARAISALPPPSALTVKAEVPETFAGGSYARQRLTDMFGENDPFSSAHIPPEPEVPVLPPRPEIPGAAVAIGKAAEGKVRFNCGVRYQAGAAVIVTHRFACGQRVAVTNPTNGKTMAVTVAGTSPRYTPGNGMAAHTSLSVSATLGLNPKKPVPVVLRALEPDEDIERLPPLTPNLPFFARPREPKAEDVVYHARNILGECANCPTTGKQAVMAVVANRTAQNFLGARTVKQTVEKPSQFSWHLFPRDVAKVNSLMRRSAGKAAKALASRRLKDQLTADEVAQVYILKDADHYFACYISPPEWAYRMTIVGYDHPHIFLVNRRPAVPHKRSDFSCRGGARVARS